MIGAGTFISPLLKIVTTVAILAAVYFFIVRPILDTTETAFETIGPGFEALDDLGPTVQNSIREAERIQGNPAASSDARIEEANKLLACIQRAEGDVDRIERCNARFDPASP